MHIRYGFDIALNLVQPTTILTMMDVHSEHRGGIVEETELQLSRAIPAARIVDRHGNVLRRLSADAGPLSLRLEGVFHTDGREDAVDRTADAAAVSELPPDALQFLLPSRYCETDLLSDFAWTNFGAIPGGWAKVQAICDFVHERLAFSYAARAPDPDRGRGPGGRRRRLPRLHPSRGGALPLPQHPGALLQRLSRRHRRSARSLADGFQRVVRGVSRRPLVYLRSQAQSPADRTDLDRARPGRGRHSDDHHLRLACADAVHGRHRGGRGQRGAGRVSVTALAAHQLRKRGERSY